MSTRLFFIVLSIVLSGQGLEECVEENTFEKTQVVEVVYEALISSETKKKIRKLSCQHSTAFLHSECELLHFVKEKTISNTPLYLQNRSFRL